MWAPHCALLQRSTQAPSGLSHRASVSKLSSPGLKVELPTLYIDAKIKLSGVIRRDIAHHNYRTYLELIESRVTAADQSVVSEE